MVIKKDYLVSKRIEIGEFFGAEPADVGVVLHEMSRADALAFEAVRTDYAKAGEFFAVKLPGLIDDHDLYVDDLHKHTAEDVAAIIDHRADLFLFVMKEYLEKILFPRGKKSA